MKALVLGRGEVGSALIEVLKTVHEVDSYDLTDGSAVPAGQVEVLNVALPWGEHFIERVQAAQYRWEPRLTIIHATVPVGSTRKIGGAIAHSPVHGVHPRLAEGLRTFVKYVGGLDEAATRAAYRFLAEAGIPVCAVRDPETSELSKLLCTALYAWNIIACKEAKRLCDEHGVAFEDVYTTWTRLYNSGYERLGMPHVARPILAPTPGPARGHCILPNARLLDSWLTRTILYRNRTYSEEA